MNIAIALALMPSNRRARMADVLTMAQDTTPAAIPALAPVTVAQFILESNWGDSELSRTALNYFGVKAVSGQPAITRDTTEVLGGRSTAVKAAFRSYGSMRESFLDHAALFSRVKAYAPNVAANARNPVAFANALAGIYATDPQYGAKLNRIMTDYQLLATFGFTTGGNTSATGATGVSGAGVAIAGGAVALGAVLAGLKVL